MKYLILLLLLPKSVSHTPLVLARHASHSGFVFLICLEGLCVHPRQKESKAICSATTQNRIICLKDNVSIILDNLQALLSTIFFIVSLFCLFVYVFMFSFFTKEIAHILVFRYFMLTQTNFSNGHFKTICWQIQLYVIEKMCLVLFFSLIKVSTLFGSL